MAIKETITKTYEITATCDECGAVREWRDSSSPDTPSAFGISMPDVTNWESLSLPALVWFCGRDCLHKWIDRKVIDRAPAEAAALDFAGR